MSLPTDCDNRDERKGWTGDAAITCDEAHHNFEMGAFYTNTLRNLRDAQ
jgi:alpha-L-rhamnosidase